MRPGSLFYMETLLRYYGLNPDRMNDKEFALTFWTLADIRQKENSG